MLTKRIKFLGILVLIIGLAITMSACDMNEEGTNESAYEPTFYELILEVEGEGTSEPEAGTYQYAENTVAHIELYPEENWKYDRFEGPDSDNIYRLGIKRNLLPMDDDKNITAVFVPEVEIGIISEEIVNDKRELEIEYNVADIYGYIKFTEEEMITPNLIEIKDGYAKEIHEVDTLYITPREYKYKLLDEEENFIKEGCIYF